MFSLPLNPKLDNIQLNHFEQFCLDHRSVIYDLYFTCRMPPFVQDAMGDVFANSDDLIHVALSFQERTGIPVSATFNNTEVRPTQENLDIFITNFEQLYKAGIRSITLPHSHWVATGQLQNRFPELLIKNTILRQVETAKDVANYAKAGFGYINLHRDLMRDHDQLKRIKKAADKFNVKLSLLANEGCFGGCAMMKEHFQFNNTRSRGPQYFNDPISRVSCSKWENEDAAYALKVANFPPWREDWDELLQYVDVIKMHGRESVQRFYETLDIVRRYHANEPILFDGFNDYINDNNLVEKPINAWRKIIKTCKFDCWDCNFCDKVFESRSTVVPDSVVVDVNNILVTHASSSYTNNVPGLTSPRVKQLLHEIAKKRANYLEIGAAMGATAVSVLDTGINVTCVDNWSTDIQPQEDVFGLPTNTKEVFESHTRHYTNLTVIDKDLFDVELSSRFDMVFYDGPHDERNVERAIKHYSRYFDKQTVLILDDANWAGVVAGARKGIDTAKFTVKFEKMFLNKVEDTTMWWNGLYIMVVERNDVIPITPS